MARATFLKSILIGGVCAIALSIAAQAEAQTRSFDVPPGDLKVALDAYARQAGVELFYRVDDVRGRRSAGVRGEADLIEALNRVLAGSGLFATRDPSGVVAVAPRPQSEAGVSPRSMAATQIDEVVVTGTRIRGGATPSPVVTLSADRMREEGASDLGEVIRNVSQNFSGGQNPGVASGNLAGAGNGNQNLTGGSSLNLRGLGADATLTLLNGRRLAYGGFTQSVDISAIPIEAVERLEIVPDGASAIYGSDAVGGVANVILRRDFSGVAVAGRYGRATDGGLSTREGSVTAGVQWSGGGLLATYKSVTVDPIYSNQRDYAAHLNDPTTLYPGSDLESGLVSLNHAVGPLTFNLDALRAERDQLHHYNLGTANSRVTPHTTTTLVSPSLEWRLPSGWKVAVGGAWGTDRHDQYRVQTVTTTGVSTVATDTCYCNRSTSYDAGLEGPLFDLPGGAARLAVGVGHRDVSFRQIEHRTGLTSISGDEGIGFGYAELNLPLVGPEQGVPGLYRLTATAAVRSENYDSFGEVTTPKLGLVYAPVTDLTLSAAWGESFKAPTLFERYYASSAYLYRASVFGGGSSPATATVLVLDGGNADLQPEKAETWSVTARYLPRQLAGLKLEATYFNIDYTDRVIQPIANAGQALSNPIYSPFVDYAPSGALQSATISNASAFFNYSGLTYDPANVAALVYTRYANVARQQIDGVDLSAEYALALGEGDLTLRGSATWLDSRQQTLPDQPDVPLAGTLFRPAEFNGRVGAVWRIEGLKAAAFVNHISGVEDTVTGRRTGSFTTLAGAVRYGFGDDHGVLSGVEVAISGQNLLDRAPPLYTPTRVNDAAPYDSTNYSAVGRFLSVTVSKRFGAGL